MQTNQKTAYKLMLTSEKVKYTLRQEYMTQLE